MNRKIAEKVNRAGYHFGRSNTQFIVNDTDHVEKGKSLEEVSKTKSGKFMIAAVIGIPILMLIAGTVIYIILIK